MAVDSQPEPLPEPIGIDCADGGDALFEREWLVTNPLGSYASGSAAGTNTRRYHGLLVAATRPPVGRIVALNCLLDELVLTDPDGGERTFALSTFEFPGAIAPDARPNLAELKAGPAATFVYRFGGVELIREIVLADTTNAVAVRYRIRRAEGSEEQAAPAGRLRIRPFAALRDFHHLRTFDPDNRVTFTAAEDAVKIEDRGSALPALHVAIDAGGKFRAAPQWWNRFRYRADLARGQDGLEDLYSPGWFEADLAEARPVQLTASVGERVAVDFETALAARRRRKEQFVAGLGDEADRTVRRLAAAAEAFVVRRNGARPGRMSILAGYHWFADWGRDAMIALPGLLLETGRFTEARAVLATFAEAADAGMVPNCFADRDGPPAYNSIDASLWFVVAADRYVRASGDQAAWGELLGPAAERILQAYHDGTRFDIRADADGLLAGGGEGTQLTWMDAAFAGRPVTPRHGKPVEVNALWHAALRVVAGRCADADRAAELDAWAAAAAAAFERTFWNEEGGCCYDCVRGEDRDGSVRPNQILAVSLPHSPLSPARRRLVVEVVRRDLLTPLGLRTLAPYDHRYRPRYGGSWESRDRSYHQGTVWAWLTGAFIEAYLKVNGFSLNARGQAKLWLAGFDAHLAEAGLGFISEIFHGDAPHRPVGCIAQAWSVAEVLRARRLVTRGPAGNA
jgi:predicted glycogen debranching enzyme